jgi:hypothetical protein
LNSSIKAELIQALVNTFKEWLELSLSHWIVVRLFVLFTESKRSVLDGRTQAP